MNDAWHKRRTLEAKVTLDFILAHPEGATADDMMRAGIRPAHIDRLLTLKLIRGEQVREPERGTRAFHWLWKPNAAGQGREAYPAPACSALIRRCNGCRRVTAIDVDDTPEHRREMEMPGHTVEVVTRREADMHWYEAGPCVCKQNKGICLKNEAYQRKDRT